MYVCHTTKELRNEVSRVKKEGKSIGLVTTMGALHEGHASLIKAAPTAVEVEPSIPLVPRFPSTRFT